MCEQIAGCELNWTLSDEDCVGDQRCWISGLWLEDHLSRGNCRRTDIVLPGRRRKAPALSARGSSGQPTHSRVGAQPSRLIP